MNDGIRTHDRLDHNQELYQLSYVHHDAGPEAHRPEHSESRRTAAVAVAVRRRGVRCTA